MKQKRRSWEEENKEKYCRFWYGWQLVAIFEIWIMAFFSLLLWFSINLFLTTLLNAKQCNFLSRCLFIFRYDFFQHDCVFCFIAADCEYVNNSRKKIYLCPFKFFSFFLKMSQKENWSKVFKLNSSSPNNMCSLPSCLWHRLCMKYRWWKAERCTEIFTWLQV